MISSLKSEVQALFPGASSYAHDTVDANELPNLQLRNNFKFHDEALIYTPNRTEKHTTNNSERSLPNPMTVGLAGASMPVNSIDFATLSLRDFDRCATPIAARTDTVLPFGKISNKLVRNTEAKVGSYNSCNIQVQLRINGRYK